MAPRLLNPAARWAVVPGEWARWDHAAAAWVPSHGDDPYRVWLEPGAAAPGGAWTEVPTTDSGGRGDRPGAQWLSRRTVAWGVRPARVEIADPALALEWVAAANAAIDAGTPPAGPLDGVRQPHLAAGEAVVRAPSHPGVQFASPAEADLAFAPIRRAAIVALGREGYMDARVDVHNGRRRILVGREEVWDLGDTGARAVATRDSTLSVAGAHTIDGSMVYAVAAASSADAVAAALAETLAALAEGREEIEAPRRRIAARAKSLGLREAWRTSRALREDDVARAAAHVRAMREAHDAAGADASPDVAATLAAVAEKRPAVWAAAGS